MRYHILGINVSVLLHTALIALVYYASHSFSPPRNSVALDFNILKSDPGKLGAHSTNQPSAGGAVPARNNPTAPNPDQAAPKTEKIPPQAALKKKTPAQRSDKRPAPLKKKVPLRAPKPKTEPAPLPKVNQMEDRNLRRVAPEENSSRDLAMEKNDPVDTVPDAGGVNTIKEQQDVSSPGIYDLADILPHQGEQREGETGINKEFIAQENPGAHRDTNLENAAGVGGGGDGMAAYYSAIRARLRDRLHYPPIARARGYAGKVIVSFTVYRNGTVQDLTVRKSCGVSILDKSALKTVKAACPFPRPSQMAKIVIPIVYSLN